jgi:hypothetical protein
VGYKEIRKRALHDHNTDALVGLEFPAEPVETLPKLMGEVIKFVPRRKPQPGFVHPA